MTPPVRRAPGSVYLVTVQAVCRMHRFVPKRRVVRMLDYCLRVVATKYAGKIRLHEFLFMSNHAHLLLTDVTGVLSLFMQQLDSLVSRNLNAMRGVTGKNFEGYSAVLIETDDLERQLEGAAYVLANPCAADLVSRSRHWKATSSLGLQYGVGSSVKRPADGLYKGCPKHLAGTRSSRSGRANYAGSASTSTASLTLHPLPGFSESLGRKEARTLVLDRLEAAERRFESRRKKNRTKVAGWRLVVSIHHNVVAGSHRELFDVQPVAAASDCAFRKRAKERVRRFVEDYYAALSEFVDGDRSSVFPHGTWLMAQRYKVPCHPAAP